MPTEIVPHLFITHHAAGSKLALGAGVYVPYGLTSQWSSDFPGRFTSQKASLQTIYVQPNIAYQINSRWSVGGGPIWGHSSVELRQSVDLSAQLIPGISPSVSFGQLGIPRRTEFARARLKGDGTGYGAQVGILGKLNDAWTLGVRYLSPITFKYDDADATFEQVSTGLTLQGPVPNPADPSGPPAIPAGTSVDDLVAAQFQPGGALVSQSASTTITHPAQAQVGLSYGGFSSWTIEADYAWIQWSRFSDLPVNFENAALSRSLIEDYQNSSSLRLGVEHAFANQARLRFGAAGATSAAPDESVTPLLPEQDRGYLTIGGSCPLTKSITIDGAYARIGTRGRRGRLDERTDRTTTASQLNVGAYGLSANIFSLSLRASF
jgi:long-chain fatty acid transport protein